MNTPKQKTVKKITEPRLQNMALYYLERFGGTEKSVRDILNSRIKKSIQAHPDQNIQDIEKWMDTVINTLISYGYINDTAYADVRIKKLLNKGKSMGFIRADLHAKGVKPHSIDKCLSAYDTAETNARAVQIYVQKRRLGVYRYTHQDDIDAYLQYYQDSNTEYYKHHQKDLSKCARQGFSYSDSQHALLNVV